jgi:hypothetical protein
MNYTIRQLIEKILSGQIRIPSFQRGYIWEPELVAYLMDSIYKGYPFGNLLFWKTKESLKFEKKIGPFEEIKKEAGLPIDYVLDGQQRITSIFGVFQNELNPIEDTLNFDIYFDFSSETDAQETQFFSLKSEEVDSTKYFPLKCLFDSVKYREATDPLQKDQIQKIDALQTKFKEAQIPIQFLETEDKAKVAIVFERINRRGVELDTFQLLGAWTWSEEFDLQSFFYDLQEELEPFGFKSVGEDVDLLLRCAAGIISGNASAKSLIELNGALVRTRFDEVKNGLKGALDFLKSNLKIEKLDNIPFGTLLIPLSVFFAISGTQQFNYSDGQRQILLKWFWKSSFSKRYGAGTLRNINKDIEEIKKLKSNEPSSLADFNFDLTTDFYINNQFRRDSISTKTFILQLAQNNPRSFISGSPISLRDVLSNYNRNEFHHIFPKAFLKGIGIPDSKINSLANFCFMSKSDNNRISGDKPSIYKTKLGTNVNDILSSTFSSDTLFLDDYDKFLNERATNLWKNGLNLTK